FSPAHVRPAVRLGPKHRVDGVATRSTVRGYASYMRKNVGKFIDDAAEARFKQAFDRAMTSWPTRVDLEITTSVGRTVVSTVEGPSDGTPVLLLPGGGSTIAPWGPFAEAWSAARTVIAVDTIWDAGRSVQTKPIPSGIEAA